MRPWSGLVIIFFFPWSLFQGEGKEIARLAHELLCQYSATRPSWGLCWMQVLWWLTCFVCLNNVTPFVVGPQREYVTCYYCLLKEISFKPSDRALRFCNLPALPQILFLTVWWGHQVWATTLPRLHYWGIILPSVHCNRSTTYSMMGKEHALFCHTPCSTSRLAGERGGNHAWLGLLGATVTQ